MAMTKCAECKKEISSAAKACPSCGAPVKKKTGMLALLIAGFFLVSIFVGIFSQQSAQQNQAQIEAAKTPEQRAREQKEKKAEDMRYAQTVIAGTALKQSLKDPSSLVFEKILADEDAKTICMTYRAKNSFGALNKEFMLFHNGRPSQTESAWNKRCANKSMYDMIFARQAIQK